MNQPFPSNRLSQALLDLNQWFARHQRVLPWREAPSPYRVWVSEVMLQQTQVITVIPYFERFIRRFPDVYTLAEAPLDEVMVYWAGLGYYSRARNLHRAAGIIAQEGFPPDRTGWEKLPGVGPYTAGAVLSIAYRQPEAILDANIEKVLTRLRRIETPIVRSKKRLWRLSACILRKALSLDISPPVINQALMELGALLCLDQNPRCPQCPFVSLCRAHIQGEPEKYPVKNRSKDWVDVKETVYWLEDAENRVLVKKQTAGEWRAGLWDLPEELPPVKYTVTGEVETRHTVTRHRIRRRTLIARINCTGAPLLPDGEYIWLAPIPPFTLAVGSAFKKTALAVQEYTDSLFSRGD